MTALALPPQPVALRTRVVVADDLPLIVAGIRRTLERTDDIEVVGEATGPEVLLALVHRRRPHVVMVDAHLSAGSADLVTRIRHGLPDVKVVVLARGGDRLDAEAALGAGASAYLAANLDPAELPRIIREVMAGRVVSAPAPASRPTGIRPAAAALTDRERTILSAVASGATTSTISRQLWVSEHTVKFHLTNIYRKLGVSNRAGAVRFALEHGLVG